MGNGVVGGESGRFWKKVMFRFKQFTVHQENSAMKVCTDSCLFGALIRSRAAEKALDIGAGTGLLSLMVAQRLPLVRIDAVEMDAGAAKDARANFTASPFRERLTLHECAIQDFQKEPTGTYDLVFSNPPFYENQLKSPDPARNLAHHAAELSFRELALQTARHLKNTGFLWILLPPEPMERFVQEAGVHALQQTTRYRIRQRHGKPIFREIGVFSRSPTKNPATHEILLYENEQYSRIFAGLLRDYYLIF